MGEKISSYSEFFVVKELKAKFMFPIDFIDNNSVSFTTKLI
jgi:hypothetical protein